MHKAESQKMTATANTIGAKTQRNVAERTLPVMVVLLGVVLWGWAGWVTYRDIGSALTLVKDLDFQVHSLVRAVMSCAGYALPMVAAVALLVAASGKSRLAWSVALIWLPLTVGAGLYIVNLVCLHGVLEAIKP